VFETGVQVKFEVNLEEICERSSKPLHNTMFVLIQ
jgi:hypothetical protein